MIQLFIIAVYVVELIALAIAAFLGYRRGLFNSLVRTVCLLLVALISAFVSRPIASPLSDLIVDYFKSIPSEKIISLVETTPETFELVNAAINPIVFLFIFPSVFAALDRIFSIICKAVSSLINKKINKTNLKDKKWNKLGGTGVSILNGIIITAIVLLPISLIISTVSVADSFALETLGIPAELISSSTAKLYVPSSLILKPCTLIEDNSIPDEYSSLKGQKVNMSDELPCIINVVGYASAKYIDLASEGKTSDQAILGAVTTASRHTGGSKLVPPIISKLANLATGSAVNGEPFLETKFNITDKLESEDSKEIIHDLSTTIEDNLTLLENTDYNIQLETVDNYISQLANKYNYPLNEEDIKLYSISIVAYINSTENVTAEGLMSYLGFDPNDIDDLLGNTSAPQS